MPDDSGGSDDSGDGEELLYSAEIVCDDGVYRLYLRDHTSGLLLTTQLTSKAVSDLPKYAAMLKLKPVV